MRLLNDGDRYNQIFFAAAQFALASRWLQQVPRWLQQTFVSPVVMRLPGASKDRMRQHRVNGQQQSLI